MNINGFYGFDGPYMVRSKVNKIPYMEGFLVRKFGQARQN